MKKSALSLLAAASLVLAACGHAVPSARGLEAQALSAAAKRGEPFQVTKTTQGSNWDRIERLTSTYGDFPVEHMRPNGRQVIAEIVNGFGAAMPPSSQVLLHYGKSWQKNTGVPVLLVHGAIVDADTSWVKTYDGSQGLLPSLEAAGRRVFAVTFAHRHGDNQLQAQQIANAIARIKAVTGSDQVDVVAHSKGVIAARALASNMLLPWMTPYRSGDIRRLVLVAGPNLGLDFTFRHPLVNYGLYPEQDDRDHNGPMSWTKMLYMGQWIDTSSQTIMTDSGNFFPGQDQMLSRWDKTYPLPVNEQDWYTTYNGGTGFTSVSPGIDKAITQSGHFMDRLRQHPLDSKIQLSVLAGDSATLPGVLNENTGPSDGLVFVKSATATDDMTAGGAKLVDTQVMHLNHIGLITDPKAKAWIADQLK